jgi:hypothetical protein
MDQGAVEGGNTTEINQFVDLWLRVRETQLTDHDDEISWKFMAKGTYSTKCAYSMQFAGTFAEFSWADLWRARTKNKCKFLSWLLLQNKVWSVDRIIKVGGQTNPTCQMCRTQPESAAHADGVRILQISLASPAIVDWCQSSIASG